MSDRNFPRVRCTIVGRVVYDKPTKPWRWSDLNRVARALNRSDEVPQAGELRPAVQTWIRITLLVTQGLKRSLLEETAEARAIVLLLVPGMVDAALELLEQLADQSQSVVRRGIDRLLDILPSGGA